STTFIATKTGKPCLPDKPQKEIDKTQPAKDLDFELDDDHIAPGFLRADVSVDELGHILFATGDMLHLLERARVWYLDGTFKLVKEPFYQLFSIHSFIKSGTAQKQVPLLFCMSGKRKRAR
ncbi:uncharacterized protein LOC117120951, partial [Anneissia japonica]|uniref:uncharacterized protein LOC117120951 n=1 Tax=Anneissia japonica TaxID=1529436 RepID=UPI001425568C